MADYDIAVTFATAAGSPVLVLDSADESTYTVVSASPVEETRQRATVTSPDMHGAAEVSSVLAEGVYGLVVRCRGASWAGVWAARDTLVAAATAVSWLLTVDIEGVARSYRACAANVSNPIPGPEVLSAGWLDVTLSIPVHPVPEEA